MPQLGGVRWRMGSSALRNAVAVMVLVVAALVLVKVLAGVVVFAVKAALVVGLIAGAVWAWRTLRARRPPD